MKRSSCPFGVLRGDPPVPCPELCSPAATGEVSWGGLGSQAAAPVRPTGAGEGEGFPSVEFPAGPMHGCLPFDLKPQRA